jgi:hypothetical protein
MTTLFCDHAAILKTQPQSSYKEQYMNNIVALEKLYSEVMSKRQKFKAGSRTMQACFADGQQIRHRLRESTWIGSYNKTSNTIVYETKVFDTLHGFALAHLNAERPNRATKTMNAWRECETEINGKWVSTFMLSPLESPSEPHTS